MPTSIRSKLANDIISVFNQWPVRDQFRSRLVEFGGRCLLSPDRQCHSCLTQSNCESNRKVSRYGLHAEVSTCGVDGFSGYTEIRE